MYILWPSYVQVIRGAGPSAVSSPVQILHQSRVQAGPAREAEAAAFLGRLRKDKALYTAPFGSNDDWYWIYAAVEAGRLRHCKHPTLTHHRVYPRSSLLAYYDERQQLAACWL